MQREMSYTALMSTQNVLRLYLSFATILTLGSCSTFHTPLSRSLVQQEPNSSAKPNSEPAAFVAAPDESAMPDLESNKAAFDWPVDEARLTRGFLPKKRRPHWGIDLASKRGTPILASHGGLVIYTGREFRGYGKMVLIESGQGWATLYAHMDKILVQEGQKVSRGQLLGAMGRTGRATGVHLHFEIRKDRGPIDPLPLLPHGAKVASYLRERGSKN